MRAEDKAKFPQYIVAAGFFTWAFFSPWGVTGAEIGLAIALVGALVDIALERRFPQAKTAWIPMALFLFWALICSSEGKPITYDNFRHMWIFLMFFVSAIYLDGHISSRNVLTLFMLSLAVCAVYSIVQHYTGLDLMHHDTEEKFLKLVKDWKYQVVGMYSHHLTLANVMLAGSVLTLARGLGSIGRERIFWLIAGLLMATAMFFTFAHGPLVGFFAAIVFLAVAVSPKRSLPILAAIVLLAVLLLAISHNFRYFLFSAWGEQVHIERIYLWKATLRIISEYPLFGVGPGNFKYAVKPLLHLYEFKFTTAAHAHNSFLQYAAEFGIPGAVLIVWFFATLFWQGVTKLRDLQGSKGRRYVELASYLAALFGLIVSGMTQHVFGDSEVALIAWLLCGIISDRTFDPSKGSGAERAA